MYFKKKVPLPKARQVCVFHTLDEIAYKSCIGNGQLEINKHKRNADYRCRNEIKLIPRPLKLDLKLIIQIFIRKNDRNSLIKQKLIDVIV